MTRDVACDSTVPACLIRLRKFIGAIALLLLVVVWALVAMALAQTPAIQPERHRGLDLLHRRRARLGRAGDAAGAVDVPQGRRRKTADRRRTIEAGIQR